VRRDVGDYERRVAKRRIWNGFHDDPLWQADRRPVYSLPVRRGRRERRKRDGSYDGAWLIEFFCRCDESASGGSFCAAVNLKSDQRFAPDRVGAFYLRV
jgi:hypothetical protein